MDLKRIAVIAKQVEYAQYLKLNLELYLGNRADIKYYTLDEVEQMKRIPADYVVVSAFTIFQRLKWKIGKNSELIIVYLALNREKLSQLEILSKGTRAYLVNIDYRTCMQVITQIYEAGFRDLDLIAYYGEGPADPSIRIAITPNELELIPQGIEQIIDIGERVLDPNCSMDIAERLGIRDVYVNPSATEARNKAYVSRTGMERLLGENESLSGQINILLSLMDQGIIITDLTGKICLSNKKAKQLLRLRSDILDGFGLPEVLPEIDVFLMNDTAKEDLINIGGNDLMIGGNQIKVGDEIRGGIFTITEFNQMEEKQHHMRTRLSGSTHTASHQFDNIVGKSGSIQYTIATAKRMAKSDSSVLITGESGTGKEVFAQSIHNASRRARYNFVAVNCAAIPESLLESEMFGYEEGAFTGAKKGGKPGFFELAHNGTIFLDEIGEMPLQLQSKLLRVIEEKRILRVGSHRLIDVNVRIIAATNKDLLQLIDEGKFREDFYYRLNVLPLHLPSLRERKEDIPFLIEHFIKTMNADFHFDIKAMKLMSEHAWRGNIRELRNMIEYLENLGNTEIKEQDLLFVMRNALRTNNITSADTTSPEDEDIKHFIYQHRQRMDMFKFILDEIESANTNNKSMGRYALNQIAESRGLTYTERELRTCLTKLHEGKYVISKRGRGGSKLTDNGKALLKYLI